MACSVECFRPVCVCGGGVGRVPLACTLVRIVTCDCFLSALPALLTGGLPSTPLCSRLDSVSAADPQRAVHRMALGSVLRALSSAHPLEQAVPGAMGQRAQPAEQARRAVDCRGDRTAAAPARPPGEEVARDRKEVSWPHHQQGESLTGRAMPGPVPAEPYQSASLAALKGMGWAWQGHYYGPNGAHNGVVCVF